MSRFDDVRIFSGTGSSALAASICSYMGIREGDIEITTFPNENIFVKIGESVREQDVFVLQSFSSPLCYRIYYD